MAAFDGQLKPLPGESVCLCASVCVCPSLCQSLAVCVHVWVYVFVCVNHFEPSLKLCRLHAVTMCDFLYLCSWRNVLRTWGAPPRLWALPWLSCSPVLPRAINTTLVCQTICLETFCLLKINTKIIFLKNTYKLQSLCRGVGDHCECKINKLLFLCRYTFYSDNPQASERVCVFSKCCSYCWWLRTQMLQMN